MTDTDRQAAIAALQARRAARGMADPLNRLRAVVAASDSPAIVEQPAPHVMTRPAPMTAETAREIVATMQRETSKPARIRLMQTALRIGNLSDAANDVYRAALAQDEASAYPATDCREYDWNNG